MSTSALRDDVRSPLWRSLALAAALLFGALSIGCSSSRSSVVPSDSSVRERASSTCNFPAERDGVVTLALIGIDWDGWQETCRDLAPYLRVGAPPYDGPAAIAVERLLEETGYFRLATCEIRRGGLELECVLQPQPIVRELRITGRLPVGLLREELERRLMVAPGALVEDEEALVANQRQRLLFFLEREGYFESNVTLDLIPIGRAEPNLGLLLSVHLDIGRTAQLRDVRLEGENPLEEVEVESRLRRFGFLGFFERRFRPQRFQEDLDEITLDLQTQGWPEARATGEWLLDPADDFVDVVVRIEAGPTLDLRFVGNEALEDSSLEELGTFAAAGIIDETEMERTRLAIRGAYQEAGFPDARVTSESEEPAPLTIRITYGIEEGPRADIRRLSFEGNEALSDRTIRRRAEIATSRTRFIWRGRWVDTVVTADEASIEALYRREGHAAAEVTAARTYRPDGNLEVVFRISEGPRREVGEVTLTDLPADVNERSLGRRLEMRRGEPFVEGRLERDRNEILTTLATEGYPTAEVATSVDPPPAGESGQVAIEHVVLPGPRSVMGGILVRGNFRTRPSLIVEQLELDLGDTLDLVTLGEARRRLRGLGAFTSVEVEPLGLWLDEPETWQMVSVQERRARSADVVGSYATDEGFTVGFDFRDRNLFGRAIHLDLRLRLGEIFGRVHPRLRIGRSNLIDGSIRGPRPFGLPFDLDGTLFYRFEDQPNFLEERLGAGAGLSRQVLARDRCRYCPDAIVQVRYEVLAGRLDLEAPLPDDQEPAELPPLARTPLENIGRIAPMAVLDRRDSFVDPRSGYAGDIRLELAHALLSPLPEGHNFVRLLSGIRLYLDLGTPWERPLGRERWLGGPFVVAVNAGFALARPLDREPGLPASEALYYGGDYSVRGLAPFASAAAFPGANYRATSSVEVRWYAARNVFLGSLQLAVFLDAASVAYELGALTESPAVSVGPLLRYITPVGPLTLGWGVAIVRPPEIVAARPEAIPERGRLHLTLGYAF